MGEERGVRLTISRLPKFKVKYITSKTVFTLRSSKDLIFLTLTLKLNMFNFIGAGIKDWYAGIHISVNNLAV